MEINKIFMVEAGYKYEIKNCLILSGLKKEFEFILRICRDIRLFAFSEQTQPRTAFFYESYVKVFLKELNILGFLACSLFGFLILCVY